jgi:hypothetical protein
MIAKTEVRKSGDEWISIEDAARIMECSKSWVLVLLNSGELAGSKIHARAWLVSKKAAEQNLADYRKASTGKRRVGRPRAVEHGRGSRRGVELQAKGPAMKVKSGNTVVQADDLINITTASEISGVHRSWLHQLIKRGDLTRVEIDGNTFLLRSEVAAFQRSKRGRPSSKKPA